MNREHARRSFLRYLAASPLVAAGVSPFLLTLLKAAEEAGADVSERGEIIASPKDALNVFDFHAVAREKLPPAHYGYLATGSDDDGTLRANREGFRRFQLRSRRLVDVEQIDASVELLGTKWPFPIALAPAGSQKAFHPEGEAAVARAAGKTSTLQILSNFSNTSVEDAIRERGGPVWFQLYPLSDWGVNEAVLRRAERAGCPVVVLTVDAQAGRNAETFERFSRRDSRDCSVCHDRSSMQGGMRRKPMLSELDLSQSRMDLGITWAIVDRIRNVTGMKLIIKGIVTAEDAALCVERGADGLIISNHGGRTEPSGRGAIECLEEIVGVVRGRIPVLIDSGFRRGSDVFKALALGADAVCVGRPYLWALASFGQEGVEAVIELLRAELTQVMRQSGTPSVDWITREHVRVVG